MPTTWYASPTGLASNPGTLASPWDIASALKNTTQIQPGDTLLLRGGTYACADRSVSSKGFGINLQGSVSAPIVVKPYNNEHVIIDGGLHTYAGQGFDPKNIVIEGLDILVSENLTQTRTSTHAGSDAPADLIRPWGGIDLLDGQNISIINNTIHDNMQGIGVWRGVQGALVYGNLIYDNGWNAPDRGHGHGIYTQNNGPTTDTIADNIFVGNYDNAINAYGSTAANANYYDVERNFVYADGTHGANRMLLGGQNAISNIRAANNVAFNGTIDLGYDYAGGDNIDVENNTAVLAGGLQIQPGFTNLTSTGNFSWGVGYGIPQSAGINVPKNQPAIPTTPLVFFNPNQYDPNRANLAVIDFKQDATAQVPVGTFLQPGDNYELFDPAKTYGAPIASGTYGGGGTITVPLSGNMQQIYQSSYAQGAFYVVVKISAASQLLSEVSAISDQLTAWLAKAREVLVG
ncbi:MAG TPA: right-handed parallel beta-helix repeat-containing protein [Pirellulales bacterium]|nr:right-handed parallel beta-helix repeat-containing protein [Pirellulales bacterium]